MKLIKISQLFFFLTVLFLSPNLRSEKIDEFSLGSVTKSNYKELDWEDFRKAEKPLIERGVIDGFLSVKETSPGSYQIYLYETLEAMEHDRPRKSFGIAADLFREGLSLETRQKNFTLFHKKWVKIYGIFEYLGRQPDLPFADTIRCESVEWRNSKGELVRTLEQ
jgi:hypothetical protein